MCFFSQKRFALISVFLIAVLFLIPACTDPGNDLLPSELLEDGIERVGFDVDDTLLFSTPSFQQGFKSNYEPFSKKFWEVVNSSDAKVSCIKPKVYKIVEAYHDRGVEVYAITAREDHNGEHLRKYLEKSYNIPSDHTFFEPDGKDRLIQRLNLDVYYGDSDSDIQDAQKVDIKAVRIQRNENSSYHKKYNPGKFNEPVIEGTKNHDCTFKPYK
jgi:acid phosphatase (class B)